MTAFSTDGKFGGIGGFEPTPEGEHNVVIVGMADMGTLERTFKGETKLVPTIVLFYTDGSFVHQDWQTFSLFRTANLVKKVIRATHGKEFDVRSIRNISEAMIGKLLRIEVEHNVTPDKVYANISGYLKANGKPNMPANFEFPGGLHAWFEKRAEGLAIHPKIKIGLHKDAAEGEVDDEEISF